MSLPAPHGASLQVAELFGVEFIGGDHRRLLLNPEFEGTPLRKDEVLAARTGMNWPGAKGRGDRGLAGPSSAGAARGPGSCGVG